MKGVRLPPLTEEGEAVGETHGETILGETRSLEVLKWMRILLVLSCFHLLEDLFLCSSQMFNVVDS